MCINIILYIYVIYSQKKKYNGNNRNDSTSFILFIYIYTYVINYFIIAMTIQNDLFYYYNYVRTLILHIELL